MLGMVRCVIQFAYKYPWLRSQAGHRLTKEPTDHERKPRSLPTALAFLMRPWFSFLDTPYSAQKSLMIWLWYEIACE